MPQPPVESNPNCVDMKPLVMTNRYLFPDDGRTGINISPKFDGFSRSGLFELSI